LPCRIHASPVTAVRCWFLSPYGLFGLSNPRVIRESSSLMISQSLGAVWAVESMCHPWQQFVDDFWVPTTVSAVESMCHPWQQFVVDFWVPTTVWAVESLCHQWQHFVDDFSVRRCCLGFMWSLSVLIWLFSLWIDWLSSSAMFSKENEDFLESLPLNVRVQTLMQVQKKRKEKEKEKEQN